MIKFPDPAQANAEGLLAIGGNLDPETLLAAYRRGIFPWYSEGDPPLWWSPDPRMVLFPAEFYCSRRLARRMRQDRYRITVDVAFAAVIGSCATIKRTGQDGTWILPEMVEAYRRLYTLGHAHSIEVWERGALIGGLYGVQLNRAFFAESMFSRRTDGSKMALAALSEYAIRQGMRVIDCQFYSDHLASLGAREIGRDAFLKLIGAD